MLLLHPVAHKESPPKTHTTAMSGKLPPAGNVKAEHRFQLFGTTPTNHKQAGRTACYASIALTRVGRI